MSLEKSCTDQYVIFHVVNCIHMMKPIIFKMSFLQIYSCLSMNQPDSLSYSLSYPHTVSDCTVTPSLFRHSIPIRLASLGPLSLALPATINTGDFLDDIAHSIVSTANIAWIIFLRPPFSYTVFTIPLSLMGIMRAT